MGLKAFICKGTNDRNQLDVAVHPPFTMLPFTVSNFQALDGKFSYERPNLEAKGAAYAWNRSQHASLVIISCIRLCVAEAVEDGRNIGVLRSVGTGYAVCTVGTLVEMYYVAVTGQEFL